MREQTLNQEYNKVIIKHFPTRFTALEDFLNLKQRRGATWMNPLSSPSFEAKTQTHHDVVVEDAILSNFLFLFLLDTCLEKSNRVYISNHKSFAFSIFFIQFFVTHAFKAYDYQMHLLLNHLLVTHWRTPYARRQTNVET